ncbi:hypothetical protein [Pseudobacteriovorax antillogorgiicola]|uniref:Uncharacterized protein n=1 Tax=Pseudobacteriovorax antillogorgiicola TaxID=1513793 RepID=A0A1Y6BQC0_9BACT|nr:hypothetical protein [Pseudobacteriovorax antillogorgiicola]TCS53829.1 hypothetical protein EDD56_107138 [Pseudobacteriovorax antillogorgiicola]SMF21783.1 hypothetical protein SAMN06296036_107134 [Pseudobacteriovorax antillogorgiicola]
MDQQDLKDFIRELIIEEFSPEPVELAQKWQGGSILLQPGNETQGKEIPMDVFLRKVLAVRDALRVLEQKLNGSGSLTAEEKASFHGYITKAYGALTTFNVLFKDGKDKFVGSGGGGKGAAGKKEKMTLTEAKAKLGLNEY